MPRPGAAARHAAVWPLYLCSCKGLGFSTAAGSERLVASPVRKARLPGCCSLSSFGVLGQCRGFSEGQAPGKPNTSARVWTQGVSPLARATLKPFSRQAFRWIMTDGPAEALRKMTEKKQGQLRKTTCFWGYQEAEAREDKAVGQFGGTERAEEAVGSPERDGRRHYRGDTIGWEALRYCGRKSKKIRVSGSGLGNTGRSSAAAWRWPEGARTPGQPGSGSRTASPWHRGSAWRKHWRLRAGQGWLWGRRWAPVRAAAARSVLAPPAERASHMAHGEQSSESPQAAEGPAERTTSGTLGS